VGEVERPLHALFVQVKERTVSWEQLELLHAAIKAFEDYQRMSGTMSATFILGLDCIKRIEDVDA
jgi:hypothetical protein